MAMQVRHSVLLKATCLCPASWGRAVDIQQMQHCAVLAVLETCLLLHIVMQVHPLTGLHTSKTAVSARLNLVCTSYRTPTPCCLCHRPEPPQQVKALRVHQSSPPLQELLEHPFLRPADSVGDAAGKVGLTMDQLKRLLLQARRCWCTCRAATCVHTGGGTDVLVHIRAHDLSRRANVAMSQRHLASAAPS